MAAILAAIFVDASNLFGSIHQRLIALLLAQSSKSKCSLRLVNSHRYKVTNKCGGYHTNKAWNNKAVVEYVFTNMGGASSIKTNCG